MHFTTEESKEVIAAWRNAVPTLPNPEPRFISGWLYRASLDEIKEIMFRLARLYREGKLDPDTPETHAGKFVSAGIRMLREREQQPAEQEPRGEIAACDHQPAPLPPQPERWRQSWPDLVQ
jgi:hypothetical protein